MNWRPSSFRVQNRSPRPRPRAPADDRKRLASVAKPKLRRNRCSACRISANHGPTAPSDNGGYVLLRGSHAMRLRCEKKILRGNPRQEHISTSFVERRNLTICMRVRRFTRLTNAFSKKVKNLAHSVALHFMHYNFVRRHQSLKMSPAMAAGVDSRLCSIEDVVG